MIHGIEVVKLCPAAMIHLLESRQIIGVHLLTLGKPRRVLKLAAVQRLLDAAHNVSQRLALGLTQFDGLVVILHYMSLTVIVYTGIGLVRHHYAYALVLVVMVKSRNLRIVIGQAYRDYLPTLCLECTIAAALVLELFMRNTKCSRKVSYECIRLISFVKFIFIYKSIKII